MASQRVCASLAAAAKAEADHTLDLRGPRGHLSGEEIRRRLAPVLVEGRKDFKKVILSTWAWCVESAEVMVQALKQMPNLETVNMADIIAGRPEAEAQDVYRTLGKALKDVPLVELDLSDNAVGPLGMSTCGPFMAHQFKLQRLIMYNCGMSAEAMRTVSDLMLFRVPTELRVLHFGNNMSDNGGAIALADIVCASPHLESLQFSSSRGKREGGIALAKSVAMTPKLTHLNFSDNGFGNAGAAALAASIKAAKLGLVELNMSDTGLGDAAVGKLGAAFAATPTRTSLKALRLSGNDFTAEAAGKLVTFFSGLPSLQTLVLDENFIEDDGVAGLAAGLLAAARGRKEGTCALEELSLREVGMTAASAATLAAALVSARATALKVLDVGDNEELCGAGKAALVKALTTLGLDAAVVLKGLEEVEAEEDADVTPHPCPEPEEAEEPAEAKSAAAAAAAALAQGISSLEV